MTTRALRGSAAAALVLAVGISGSASAAVPTPPKGAATYKIRQSCKQFTTSGGYEQVRVNGYASTRVYKMPKKPRLATKPHRIYQRITVQLQRRVLGGWRGPKKSLKTDLTTKGQVNSGIVGVKAGYGVQTATGATFRVKATVRVYTYRRGLVHRLHWKYVAYGREFSCPLGRSGGGGIITSPGSA